MIKMKNSSFETLIGVLVIIVSILFLYLASKVSNGKQNITNNYKVYAVFDNIDGINIGSDIKISGVKIGSVADVQLNENYKAKLLLKLPKNLNIPSDSIFKVSTSGLIGSKFINIKIGGDEEFLKDGDVADFTESSMALEDLISRLIFNKENKND